MAALFVLSGRHISARSKAYSFADRDTGELRSGNAMRSWLLQDGGDGEPAEIRFRADAVDLFNDVAELAMGTPVTVEVDVSATEGPGGRAVVLYTARRIKVEA